MKREYTNVSQLNDARLAVKEEYVQISITLGEEGNFFVVCIFLCMMFQVFMHDTLEWTSSITIIGKYFQSST